MTLKKRIITAAAAAVFAVSAFPLSAFADGEAAYEIKDVTSYLYSMDKSETLRCLFLNDLPEVPYVNVEDYLDRLYTVDYTTEANGDVYTISGNGITLVADTSKETVTISNYDTALNKNLVEVEKADVADYIKEGKPEIEGTDKPASLDYSKYNIDLIGDSGKLYFPLTTLSDLFDCIYHAAEYVDNKLYFVQTMSSTSEQDGYFDRSSVYEQTERSQAMIDYTYNELCFLMDHFYGKPPKAAISKSIAEKGFDKTLDDYAEIKQLLKSKNRADFQLGLLLLTDAVDDGGHTIMFAGMLVDMDIYGENEECDMLSEFQSKMMMSDKATEIITKQENEAISGTVAIENARSKMLKDATLVKKNEENATFFYVKGETALFCFNQYKHPVVRDFAWALDYASKKGVKNFVIDIASNGGGDECISHFINTIISNKQKNSNEIATQMRNAADGNILSKTWTSDLDLNGVFDDKDKSVYYDFNYAILTSSKSFSSGNLMPCMAKDNGILILGETSGGGTCMLSKHYYPDGTYFMTSGIYTMLRGDKTDVDSGAKVDFDLTAKTADGKTDYSNFYDFAKLEECINKFYGVKKEENKKAPVIPNNSNPAGVDSNDIPPTGYNGSTIVASLLLLAAAAMAVSRKTED